VWFCIAIDPVYIKIPFAGVSRCFPAVTALIFLPFSLPCFRSFALQKSILDSSVEMDVVKFVVNGESHIFFHGVELDEEFGEHWVREPSPMSTLEEGMQHAEEPSSSSTLEEGMQHAEEPSSSSTLEEGMQHAEKLFHSLCPYDNKISQLEENINRILGFVLGVLIFQLEEKLRRILGFALGVLVLFIYQYLMGYVERGQWNTYSNGAWEFRATYVCIELRLGSYPFQKFRVTSRRYIGVTPRKYDTKNGTIYKYEPWVRFKKDKFYFEGQTTAKKAAIIRDVAKFCLKIKGRKGYNFGEVQYTSLSSVQEFFPQQSDDEIKRLVLVYAKPFLNEVQVSEEVPIVDQPPCVEPARFASTTHHTMVHHLLVECFVVSKFVLHQRRFFVDSLLKVPSKSTRGCERKIYVWNFHLNWNP
jgi:hypothetical protein